MAEYLAVLTRRSKKWSKLLQGTVKVEKNLKGGHFYFICSNFIITIFYKTERFTFVKLSCGFAVKRYVRKGVPCEHRTQIWMAASGAQDQFERNPGYYHSLLKAEHDPKIEETILAGKLLLMMKPYFI